MYYRTTTSDRENTIEYTQGGYYEKIIDGRPALVHTGDYAGFQKSTTPELCASQTPEASLFAVAHNGEPGQYHLYEINTEPDIDLSNERFDFDIIEEVRYQNLETDPITATQHKTVTVPERAIEDINLAYLPPGPSIIREWALAVRDTLQDTILSGESYPNTAASVTDVQRPNEKSYRNAETRPVR